MRRSPSTPLPQRESPASIAAADFVPIDNYVTEFLPDVARPIHVQVVVLQRIIDQVARTDGAGQ